MEDLSNESIAIDLQTNSVHGMGTLEFLINSTLPTNLLIRYMHYQFEVLDFNVLIELEWELSLFCD